MKSIITLYNKKLRHGKIDLSDKSNESNKLTPITIQTLGLESVRAQRVL